MCWLCWQVGIATASCFVGGLILLGMGLLRLGFITNFLSKSFIGGFTFAAAVHIATSQVMRMTVVAMVVVVMRMMVAVVMRMMLAVVMRMMVVVVMRMMLVMMVVVVHDEDDGGGSDEDDGGDDGGGSDEDLVTMVVVVMMMTVKIIVDSFWIPVGA